MCFRSGGFFSVFSCLFTISQKNPWLFKPIVVFTTWGQIYIVSELWLFEIKNFDLGHPVFAVSDFSNSPAGPFNWKSWSWQPCTVLQTRFIRVTSDSVARYFCFLWRSLLTWPASYLTYSNVWACFKLVIIFMASNKATAPTLQTWESWKPFFSPSQNKFY